MSKKISDTAQSFEPKTSRTQPWQADDRHHVASNESNTVMHPLSEVFKSLPQTARYNTTGIL
jgi:hypothetical protein